MLCVLCIIKEPMIKTQLRWKPVMVKQDYICYDFVMVSFIGKWFYAPVQITFLYYNKRSLTA